MMTNLLALFIGHVMGDVIFQVFSISKRKRTDIRYLLLHVLIYAVTVSSVLWLLHIIAWWKPVVLVGSHFAIDYWKCYRIKPRDPMSYAAVSLLDQGLHIAVLAFLLW
jgi:hypothetical protein